MGDLGQPVEDVARPEPDDLRMWSVTTIIGCLDKQWMKWWAAGEAATAAVRNQRTWRAMLDERGEADAITWIRDAVTRSDPTQLGAAALGTVVHACCEEYALTGRRPSAQEIGLKVRHEDADLYDSNVEAQVTEVVGFLDQFDRWLQQFSPSYQATEVVVYHPTYGYAGTCDGFLTIEGQRLIIDYKTTRKSWQKNGDPTGPYPEAALQLAAYRYAEMAAVWRPRRTKVYGRRYYLLSETERAAAVPVPEVDGGIVIHITPEHATSHAVRCDEAVYEKFLFTQEAARWQFEMSRDVIGAPMVPPAAEWPRLAVS